MSDVGDMFFKIIYTPCMIAVMCTGIVGLVKSKKTGTNKKKSVFMIVIAGVLLFSTYFSGCFYRVAPFNKETLNDIAVAIEKEENENGDDYFENPKGFRKAVTSLVGYGCKIHRVENSTTNQHGFLYNVFSKEYETPYGKFYCTPLFSDGGYGSLHCGYFGFVEFIDSAGNIYRLDYDVTRYVDVLLGPFYAIPYFGNLDLAKVINEEQAYIPSEI